MCGLCLLSMCYVCLCLERVLICGICGMYMYHRVSVVIMVCAYVCVSVCVVYVLCVNVLYVFESVAYLWNVCKE